MVIHVNLPTFPNQADKIVWKNSSTCQAWTFVRRILCVSIEKQDWCFVMDMCNMKMVMSGPVCGLCMGDLGALTEKAFFL